MGTAVRAVRGAAVVGPANLLGNRGRRHAALTPLLVLILLTVTAGALAIGPVAIPVDEVARVLLRRTLDAGIPVEPLAEQIVWVTRLPRVAMAVAAGALLAAAGAVMQALVRNPLADPYLLGVNAGASSGVALTTLVLGGASGLLLSGSALLGGTGAMLLALLLGRSIGRGGPFRLVLAGLVVGYALNAVTYFLIFASDSPEASRSVLFWLLGSLTSVQPLVLAAVAAAAVVLIIAATVIGPWLDALSSGDDSARAVGLDPDRARLAIAAGTAALVGLAVAGVGGVGFIGLVVPRLAHRLVGGKRRAQLPVAALLGAALLVIADTVARTALAPTEIPVGVITGVVGAPVLLALLATERTGR